MSAFTKPMGFRTAAPGQRLQAAMDAPFGGDRFVGEVRSLTDQIGAGALTTPGLGTVLRNAQIPQGNTAPDMGGALPNPVATIGRLAQQAGAAIRGDDQQPSMTKEEYHASPYFREAVPFEQGMTQDRAAALAMFYDQKTVRDYFGAKRPVGTFIGQFAGQALDPINYVPVFGEAAQAAAVARFGSIAGRALIGASDAAINTAVFGALTSDMRAKFGDDVSWQATISEIGMSALVGGAFGAGAGALALRRANNFAREDAYRARQREAMGLGSLQTAENIKASRAILNEGVGAVANGRDYEPSPNTIAEVERIQTEAASTVTSSRALAEQTRDVVSSKPGDVAITPTGTRVSTRPEIIDATALVKASGDLQVRNRGTQTSAQQIEDIAINLDPALLMPSVNADSGAPIVGPDNVVDSGNGRVAALVRASQAYPEKFAAYKQALRDAGYDVPDTGIPILVSRRTTELSHEARVQFNADANAPRGARMGAVELAAMDRAALTDSVLADLADAPINAAGNKTFVAKFLGNLAQNERGALSDNAGGLSSDGIRRIENALVSAAYGDVDEGVIRRFAESPDDNTRAIVGAMSDMAGKWAKMRRAIKSGDVSPEFDVTPELTQALRMVGDWRAQATAEKRPVSVVIKEGMAQIDMLSGEVPPEVKLIIGAFYQSEHYTRAAGRETIAEFLGKIADEVEELGRPQLFGTADVSKMEVLRRVNVDEQGDIFASVGPAASVAENVGQQGRPADGAAGEGNQGAAGEGGRASVEPKPDALAPEPRQSMAAIGPANDTIADAAKRVGQGEDARQVAATYGIDYNTGAFVEQGMVDQIRAEGRIDPETEKLLADLDAEYENAEAWNNALGAALNCII